MSNLYIVTVATESKYYFPYLQESCKKNGKELVVLGYGQKWQGFNWRFTLMLDYLKTLKKNDIVCFVDGYDVVCTRNLNELKDVFLQVKKKYNCKIIVGEDKVVVNDLFSLYVSIYGKTFYSQCNNQSLNAGTYIGYVEDLMDIVNKIYNLNPIDHADDQILLTKYCKLNPSNFYVDKNGYFFLTLVCPSKEIDKELTFTENNNKIVLQYKNNFPFFIHAAGETFLDNVIIRMGYNYDYNNKISKIIHKKNHAKMLFIIKKNMYKIIFLLILFLLLLYFIYYIVFIKNKNKKYIKKSSK